MASKGVYNKGFLISNSILEDFNNMENDIISFRKKHENDYYNERINEIYTEKNRNLKALNGVYQIFEKMAVKKVVTDCGSIYYYESKQIYLGIARIYRYWCQEIEYFREYFNYLLTS